MQIHQLIALLTVQLVLEIALFTVHYTLNSTLSVVQYRLYTPLRNAYKQDYLVKFFHILVSY